MSHDTLSIRALIGQGLKLLIDQPIRLLLMPIGLLIAAGLVSEFLGSASSLGTNLILGSFLATYLYQICFHLIAGRSIDEYAPGRTFVKTSLLILAMRLFFGIILSVIIVGFLLFVFGSFANVSSFVQNYTQLSSDPTADPAIAEIWLTTVLDDIGGKLLLATLTLLIGTLVLSAMLLCVEGVIVREMVWFRAMTRSFQLTRGRLLKVILLISVNLGLSFAYFVVSISILGALSAAIPVSVALIIATALFAPLPIWWLVIQACTYDKLCRLSD